MTLLTADTLGSRSGTLAGDSADRSSQRIFSRAPGPSASALASAASWPPLERHGYSPSRRTTPLAAAGALAMVAGVAACLVLASIVSRQEERRPRLAVITLRQLDRSPPPRALQPRPTRVTPVTVPPPRLTLPAKGPQVPVALMPPPPAPVAVAIEAPVAKPAPAATGVAAGASPSQISGGDLSSKMLSAVPPQYPIESRRRHEQGTVRLLVVLGTDGTVAQASVAQSSGSFRLDRAALGAVRRWRWSPTLVSGVAVSVRGTVSIPFALTA